MNTKLVLIHSLGNVYKISSKKKKEKKRKKKEKDKKGNFYKTHSSPSSIPKYVLLITPLPPSSINSHPMTKSKHGIHKPKLYKAIIDHTYIMPPSYVVSSQYPQWIATLESKFDYLKIQSSCSLVPPLVDKNIVTYKWVYKLKRHSFGTEKFYASLT